MHVSYHFHCTLYMFFSIVISVERDTPDIVTDEKNAESVEKKSIVYSMKIFSYSQKVVVLQCQTEKLLKANLKNCRNLIKSWKCVDENLRSNHFIFNFCLKHFVD